MHVLLVEDYRLFSRALTTALEGEGHAVTLAEDAPSADTAVRAGAFDLILLDLTLPGVDGLALLRRWRAGGLETPVLVLTAQAVPAQKRECLEAGADGHLGKPFELDELFQLMEGLGREGARPAGVLRVHDLEIDRAARSVRRGGDTIQLTPREFALLEFLAARPGEVATRDMIREGLWGGPDGAGSNVVDVYIRHLRDKIDRGHPRPLILTRWGHGYMMRGEAP